MPEEKETHQPEQMAAENNKEASTTSISDTLERYKSAVDDLRAQLSKRPTQEEFDALNKQNKELLDQRIHGLPAEDSSDVMRSREELIRVINSPNSTNLDYVQACQDLHDIAIREGRQDPYAAAGKSPSAEELAEAQKVYDVFNEWIEEADGNAEVFNNIVTRDLGDGTFRRR